MTSVSKYTTLFRPHRFDLLNYMTEEEIKYRWRKTWSDQENDFVGHDPSNPNHIGDPSMIGRFYKLRTPDGERWAWYMQWGGNYRERVNTAGLSDTPREAAHEIERNFDKLKQLYIELGEPIQR